MPLALISLRIRNRFLVPFILLMLLMLSSVNLTFAGNLTPALTDKEHATNGPPSDNTSKIYFRELQNHYLKVIGSSFNTSEFHKSFAALDGFIHSPQFSQLDFSGNERAYFTWMMDYAYWLILQSNQMPQKEARLQKLKAHKHLRALLTPEVLSQDIQLADTIPASFYELDESRLTTIPPIFFYLLHKAGTYHHAANSIFYDDLRFYCYTALLQNQNIPKKIQDDIAFFLKIDTPSFQNCTPHIFLLNAVKKSDYNEISRLIELGIPVDQISYHLYQEGTNEARYDKDYDPLVHAVRNRDLIAATILIEKGADLSINYGNDAKNNIMSEALSPAIMQYAASGYRKLNTEMLDLLLAKGADINASTPDSYLLAYALNDQFSDDTVLRYLLKNGADPNIKIEAIKDIPLSIALHQAAYPEHYPRKQNFVKILIEEGHAEINRTYIRRYIKPKDSRQAYPEYVTPIYHFLQKIALQENVAEQSLQTLKYLLKSGADLSIGGICQADMDCSALTNGWEALVSVAHSAHSPAVKCLIYEYRPDEIAVNALEESAFSACISE